MKFQTYAEEMWAGEFGNEYTNRNVYSPPMLDEMYQKKYGATRTDMNDQFLADVPKNAKILEVGCNAGNQLEILKRQGWKNLAAVEINKDTGDYAAWRTDVPVQQASAVELPFENGEFDLVFTSGVLIHIDPRDIMVAMGEIARVSKRWIWGFEQYSYYPEDIEYRGKTGLLRKADYAQQYEVFTSARLVKAAKFLNDGDETKVDQMFLLELPK